MAVAAFLYTTKTNFYKNEFHNLHYTSGGGNFSFLTNFINSFVPFSSKDFKGNKSGNEIILNIKDRDIAYSMTSLYIVELNKPQFFDVVQIDFLNNSTYQIRAELNYYLSYFQELNFSTLTENFLFINSSMFFNSDIENFKKFNNYESEIPATYIEDKLQMDYRIDENLAFYTPSYLYITDKVGGTPANKNRFNASLATGNVANASSPFFHTNFYGIIEVVGKTSAFYLVALDEKNVALARKLDCFIKVFRSSGYYLQIAKTKIKVAGETLLQDRYFPIYEQILRGEIKGTIDDATYNQFLRGNITNSATFNIFAGIPLIDSVKYLLRITDTTTPENVPYASETNVESKLTFIFKNQANKNLEKFFTMDAPNTINRYDINQSTFHRIFSSKIVARNSQQMTEIDPVFNKFTRKWPVSNGNQLAWFFKSITNSPTPPGGIIDNYFVAISNGLDIQIIFADEAKYDSNYNLPSFVEYENLTLTSDKYLSNRLTFEAERNQELTSDIMGTIGSVLTGGLSGIIGSVLGGPVAGARATMPSVLALPTQITGSLAHTQRYASLKNQAYSISSFPISYDKFFIELHTIHPRDYSAYNQQLFSNGIKNHTFSLLNQLSFGEEYFVARMADTQENKKRLFFALENIPSKEAVNWLWNKFKEGVIIFTKKDANNNEKGIQSWKWKITSNDEVLENETDKKA